MLTLWNLLLFFFTHVESAKLDKKAKQRAKSHVKQEIDLLSKELGVDKDEFTVHDVFVTKRDLQGLYDDVTVNFPVGLIVELPWNVQLKTIDEKFQSRSFGAFLKPEGTLSQTDINKVTTKFM